MASPAPAKRRKLNHAYSASVLSKPFKSPLKATRPDGKSLKTQRAPQYTPSALNSVNNINDLTSRTDVHSVERPRPNATPSRRPQLTSSFSHSSAKQPPSDPDDVAVQKECSVLEHQIRTIRAEIDALKRATTIIEKDSNTGLLELGEKWRKAAQEAADSLFDSAKERVADMGGVKAWRKSQMQAAAERAFEDSFDVAEKEDVDDEDDVDYENEDLTQEGKARKQSLVAEARRKAEEEEETSFTMGMMLGSMKIELDLIGFDKQKDGWV